MRQDNTAMREKGNEQMQELKIGRVYRHFKGDYYVTEGVRRRRTVDTTVGDVSEPHRSGKISDGRAGIPISASGDPQRGGALNGKLFNGNDWAMQKICTVAENPKTQKSGSRRAVAF